MKHSKYAKVDGKYVEWAAWILDYEPYNYPADLEKVTNKPNSREIEKSNKELSHMTDALGYAVEWEFPAVKPKLWSIDR